MKSGKTIVFFVYLIFGLYFINKEITFITLPEFLLTIDKFVIIIGGGLILIGGINYLRTGRNNNNNYR